MSDSDEDLLALAGAGDSDATESDSNVPAKKKESRDKRKRSSFSDDESGQSEGEDDDDEDSFVSPYPLEGKYKDEKDRAYIEGLPEIEREQILFERGEEMQKFRQRGELARRVRERKRAMEKQRSGTKNKTLSDLKRRRQMKHRARERGEEDEDEEYERDEEEEEDREDEDEYDEDEDEREDDDRVEWDEPQAKKEITGADLNRIRFGKTLLAKYCFYPGFEDAVVGCFVRVNIGYDRERQVQTYRVCLVKGVTATAKPYTFLNRTVDVALRVAHGKSEKTFEMGFCSDGAITDQEFEQWKKVMEEQRLGLPSSRKIDRKYEELKQLQQRRLTSQEVSEIVERRKKLSGDAKGALAVIERAQLIEQRDIAMENGDQEEAARLEEQLERVERSLNRKTAGIEAGSATADRMAKLTERNRRANVEGVRKAEVQAADRRRKAAMTDNMDRSNPFERLRTNPKMFYASDARTSSKSKEQIEQEAAEAKKIKEEEALRQARIAADKLRERALYQLDDVIASIDIPLEVEI